MPQQAELQALSHKIEEAENVVKKHLSPTSVLYSSFGKDSMVMLHLTRSMGLDLPVIFNYIPMFPKKQSFARHIIESWNLKVYSFPPMRATVTLEPMVDIIYHYNLKDGKFMVMPVGVETGTDICGLDLYYTPRGAIVYPWDVAFIGHKSSDVDPHLGPIPLKEDHADITSGLKMVFPLKNFTDADVWNYTETYCVPYNTARYNKHNGYKEFADRTINNDYYATCTRCMVPGEAEVDCPKYGKKIKNVSNLIQIQNLERLEYLEDVHG